MLLFDALLRMTLARFCISAFVRAKAMSQIIPVLTVVKGVVLDCDLHFRAMLVELIQACEGTENDVTKRVIDSITLGPNEIAQGGMRNFSISTGRVLQRQWKDATGNSMPKIVISINNCIPRKKKCAKGLEFSNL